MSSTTNCASQGLKAVYENTVQRIFRWNVFRHKGPARTAPSSVKAELSLASMQRLSSEFDNPHNAFRTIHVAGTNGKGSVALKTAAALQYSGYRTGLFTSPHIDSFCERIRVNSECISEERVVEHASRIFDVIEEKQLNVTFFEIVTMMALLEFREQHVDYAVLECGLGGRLDATNIVSQKIDCTAVTSIGRDHEEILGSALEDIAAEKAGIIKPGVKGCVLGPTARPFSIFRSNYDQAGCPPANFHEISLADPAPENSNEEQKHNSGLPQAGFHRINSEIARRVLSVALNKTPEELD